RGPRCSASSPRRTGRAPPAANGRGGWGGPTRALCSVYPRSGLPPTCVPSCQRSSREPIGLLLGLAVFLVAAAAVGQHLRPFGLERRLVLDGAGGRFGVGGELVEAGKEVGLLLEGFRFSVGLAGRGVVAEQALGLDGCFLERLQGRLDLGQLERSVALAHGAWSLVCAAEPLHGLLARSDTRCILCPNGRCTDGENGHNGHDTK